METDAAKLAALNQLAGNVGQNQREPGEVDDAPPTRARILLRISADTTLINFGHNTLLSIGTSPDSRLRIPENTADEYSALNKGTIGHLYLHRLEVPTVDPCEFVVFQPTDHIKRGQGAYSRQTGTLQDPDPEAAQDAVAPPTYTGAYNLPLEPQDNIILYVGGGLEFRSRLQTDATNCITITCDRISTHAEYTAHQNARAKRSLELVQLKAYFPLFQAIRAAVQQVNTAVSGITEVPYFNQSHYEQKKTARLLKDGSIGDIDAGIAEWRKFKSSTSECAGVTLTGVATSYHSEHNSPFGECFEIKRDSDPLSPAPANDFLLRTRLKDHFPDLEINDIRPGLRVEFTPTGPFPKSKTPTQPNRGTSPAKAKRARASQTTHNHHHWTFHGAEAVQALKIVTNR